jgi:hypothetical protein
MAKWFERFVRSRWWLVVTLGVPFVVTGIGAVLLAYKLVSQEAEIVRLRTELGACEAR